MEYIIKRIKSGAWVAMGSFFVTTIGVVLENLDVFNLTDIQKVICIALGTAVVTQITKWLNQ